MSDLETKEAMNIGKIMFGAGCFWGVEAAFQAIDGVIETAVGYAGGTSLDTNYKDVCTGETGHAEVVYVEFDPDKTDFSQLLNHFWTLHDPTQLNRQGPDVGTQYRSAIFYYDDDQKQQAEESKAHLQTLPEFNGRIVTEITKASKFIRAEEYHQKYLEKRGLSSCGI